MLLPLTTPKIPGSKSKPTIWLPPKKLIKLLKTKKEKKKGRREERMEGKEREKEKECSKQANQLEEGPMAADGKFQKA